MHPCLWVCVCVYGLLVLIIMRNRALPSKLIGTVVTLLKIWQGFCFGSGCTVVAAFEGGYEIMSLATFSF